MKDSFFHIWKFNTYNQNFAIPKQVFPYQRQREVQSKNFLHQKNYNLCKKYGVKVKTDMHSVISNFQELLSVLIA
jgi:hypothetical protein